MIQAFLLVGEGVEGEVGVDAVWRAFESYDRL